MIAFLGASNLISSALTIFAGLFVAKWIVPEELGEFSSYTIISGYIVLIQLGIPSALSRELPFYLGKADKAKAYNYAATAQFWLKYLGLGILAIALFISLLLTAQSNYRLAAGTLVIGLSVWQTLYVTKYLRMLYRTNQDFNKISWIKIVVALTSFASIGLVYLFDFYGLCIRLFLVVLVDFIITYLWRPIRVQAKFSRAPFKELMKVGLPMYGVANIYGLWPLVQRTLIVSLGGSKALGLFAIVYMVQGTLQTVSSSVSNVLYPNMTSQWGEGANVKEIVRQLVRPLLFISVVFILILPIGWNLLPWFINSFLPNYSESITAAQYMLLVGFLGIFMVLSNIYNVVQKQRQRLIMYLSGIFGWLLTIFVLYSHYGFRLFIFPMGIISAYIIMIGITLFHIKSYLHLRS